MAQIDKLVHNLYRNILEGGYEYFTDNRDVGYKQITSTTLQIPLDEFPLITTKKMFTKGIVEELLWFLRGDGNIKPLIDKGINVWNKDTYKYYLLCCERYTPEKTPIEYDAWLQAIKDTPEGEWKYKSDAGRNYGVQWRGWKGAVMTSESFSLFPVDQITNLIHNLSKPNPINRRHIVTAWNPAELDQTALPACHWAFEVLPRPLFLFHKVEYAVKAGADKEYLNALKDSWLMKKDQEAKDILDKEIAGIPNYGFILKWHQRSVDSFLGLPFNIASYALLAHIIGSITDMLPLDIIGDLSNVHFYSPHIPKVEEQLRNSPMAFNGCKMTFSQKYMDGLYAYKTDQLTFDQFIGGLGHADFIFEGYESFPEIKAEMYEPTK